MKLQIMSPAAARVDFKVPPSARLDTLNGKTIGLYNNMTGGADVAVNRVAEHLSRRFSNVKFESYGGNLRPNRPALSRGVHIDGDEAAIIADDTSQRMGRELANCMTITITIANAGHLVQGDNPPDFLAAARAHLERAEEMAIRA